LADNLGFNTGQICIQNAPKLFAATDIYTTLALRAENSEEWVHSTWNRGTCMWN